MPMHAPPLGPHPHIGLFGAFLIRNCFLSKVTKTLDSLVTAMVIPSYKGQVEATQKMVGPLDDLIKSKKDDIIATQKKLSEKLSGNGELLL